MLAIKKLTSKRFLYATTASLKVCFFLIFVLSIFNFEIMHVIALASSAYAAFCYPTMSSAKTRHLIISYLIAIFFGILCYYLSLVSSLQSIPLYFYIIRAISVALTVGICILLSVEHPPSGGVAIGFLMHVWDWATPLILMASILILIFFRFVISRWIIFFKERK
jgi:hypothetical protein